MGRLRIRVEDIGKLRDKVVEGSLESHKLSECCIWRI